MPIKHLTHRTIHHYDDELFMHHKYWFDFHDECDGLSATANMDGFTVLNAIKMKLGLDTDMLREASERCNTTGEVLVLDSIGPKLFLVPRTQGDCMELADTYMVRLLRAVDTVGVRNLQFSHYSFRNNLPVRGELEVVTRMICDRNTVSQLDHLVLDIDALIYRRFFRFLTERCIRPHSEMYTSFVGDTRLLMGV